MPRKEKASKASGVGTSDVYVTSWNIDIETEEAFPSKL